MIARRGLTVGTGALEERIAFSGCHSEEMAGALLVEEDLVESSRATLHVENCSSQADGGGVVVGGNLEVRGSVAVRNCRAGASGGGVHVAGALSQLGPLGALDFDNCTAGRAGGALYVGTWTQLDGSARFSNCQASAGGAVFSSRDVQLGGINRFDKCEAVLQGGEGGCMNIKAGNLTQRGGIAEFQKCGTAASGGGAAVAGYVVQQRGVIKFTDCVARAGSGGGLFLTGQLYQMSMGAMEFSGCSSAHKMVYGGGGLYVIGDVQLQGRVSLIRCTTKGGPSSFGGGAMIEGFLTQLSGNLTFAGCEAMMGGGLYTSGFVQEGGQLHFANCGPGRGWGEGDQGGGAMMCEGSVTFNGTNSFTNCNTKGSGGCLVADDGLTQHGGVTSFRHCEAGEEGGAMQVNGNLHQMEGALEFSECRSTGRGGCLVTDRFHQSAGSLRLTHCQSHESGGAMLSYGSMDLNGTNSFANSSAKGSGGCLLVRGGNLTQHDGLTEFNSCKALVGRGGGMQVAGGLMLKSGNMSFSNCRSSSDGGGAFVESVEVYAQLTFRTCVATGSGSGGCLFVGEGVLLQHSDMFFQDCVAESYEGGGGILVRNGDLKQIGGSIRFVDCSAVYGSGGGLRLQNGSLHQSVDGSLGFMGCNADVGGGLSVKGHAVLHGSTSVSMCSAYSLHKGGGGFYIERGLQMHGSIDLSACRTLGSGGCVHVARGSIRMHGNMSLRNCSAHQSGGGAYVFGPLTQYGTSRLEFLDCSVFRHHGGGMTARRLRSNGYIHFERCTAGMVKGNGGGLAILGEVQQSGSMSFLQCAAGGKGGGLYFRSSHRSFLQQVSFDKCSAGSLAGSLYANGSMTIADLKLLGCGGNSACIDVDGQLEVPHVSMQSQESTSIRAMDLKLMNVSCLNMTACHLLAPKSNRSIAELLCPVGTGVNDTESEKACSACHDKFTQIHPSTTQACWSCPEENDFCYATQFKMKPGYAVERENVSFTVFCPNPAACPGGISKAFSTMCATGYTGKACTSCESGFGVSDNSVLMCTQCATLWWNKCAQWCYVLLKRVGLFGMAAASALTGDAERKPSSVLINQLMSFATVAGMLLVVMAQTEALRQIRASAGHIFLAVFRAVEFFADASSGQGVTESSVLSTSSGCLLQYLGFTGFLWQAGAKEHKATAERQ